ncbi:protein STICHEL-like 2 isoform X2 [Canna indica]|uniref:Protein STICHEL-like 2 isoform X2 n=1 Tax=Canna indica TaxID=4628 RepID=A0AAQ3K5Y7_9LILI|nr:protein STICHEL-like 2 isoform X2 [Canna indica]
MGEAPRHSVDIPLSKTLVALKRVKSLRDPSTNSMSKFAAVIESVNLVPNSSNKHHVFQPQHCHLKEENEDIMSNSGSNFSSRIPNPRSIFPEKTCSVKVRGPKQKRNKVSHKTRRDRARKPLDSTRIRKSTRHVEEEVDSYRETEFHSNAKERKSHYNSLRKPSSIVNCAASPCMSAGEAHNTRSRRCAVGTTTLDSQSKTNDVASPNFSGCGISYCWSGTPKYKGRNIYSDDEEQEKPLLYAEQTDTAFVDAAAYIESPRSLSQKFKPKSFFDLVGLNVVSQSLLLAIAKGKIAPMYLFHGPHGNGKTSTAKIFAAALNCLSYVEHRPCGCCRECVLSFSGTSRNIKEIDAAKVNQKERVKTLLKSASIVQRTSRFKIFIIDECQFLTNEGWEMILNSLGELPGHSVYIMITSDLDALPQSTLSRCQRYHFPKIKEVHIVGRLQKMSTEEGLEFDMDALEFIAMKSNGSLRDAETILDQLALLGKRITVSLANELIGVVSDDELLDLLNLALSNDTANTVKRARELMMSRIDPLQLVSQLANVIMDILAGKSGFSEIGRSFTERHAGADIGMQKLRHALKVLSETEKQLRTSKSQATWLTVSLLHLSTVESSPLTEINSSHACAETTYLRDNGVLNTNNAWEDIKSSFCYDCNQNKSGCSDTNCNRKKLERIWEEVTQRCHSNSFKKFLQQEGFLSAIYVQEGVAVAEVEFYHLDHVSKAAKSQDLIACALQHVLGRNVEIRVKYIPKLKRKVLKNKKSSFYLFSCSGRKQEISFSANDDYETETSARVESSFKIYSSYHAQNFLPILPQYGDKQLPDGHDTSAITIRKAEDTIQCNESIATDEHGDLLKVGKFDADPQGKLDGFIKKAEPDTQPICFPRKLKFQRKDKTAHTVHLSMQQQSKSELCTPNNAASDTYVCMYDPYTLNSSSPSQFICSSREETIPSKHSRTRTNLLCWRMPKPQILE